MQGAQGKGGGGGEEGRKKEKKMKEEKKKRPLGLQIQLRRQNTYIVKMTS